MSVQLIQQYDYGAEFRAALKLTTGYLYLLMLVPFGVKFQLFFPLKLGILIFLWRTNFFHFQTHVLSVRKFKKFS